MKINIIYWSGTGNTGEMAGLIAEGARAGGAEVEIKEVDSAAPGDVDACDVLLLGCPAMGAESLEEYAFEPFVASIEGKVPGKALGLFGSYGWGGGEWMRSWAERMLAAGGVLKVESLAVCEAPDGDAGEKCRDFGREAAR